jgi:DNA-directed RNA polymerase specialized sigma subunit
MNKIIKDPFWDYENDILNDFSKIEVYLGEFNTFSKIDLSDDEIDSILKRRKYYYEMSQKLLKYVVTNFDEKHIKVFVYFFIFGLTQGEIGKLMNISQAYVSFLLKKVKKQILENFRICNK